MPPKRLPVREPPRAIPGFPETYTSDHKEIKSRGSQYRFHMARTLHNSFMDPPNFGALEYRTVEKRDSAGDINYISPPYAIKNKVEYGLSDRTVHTNIVHYNGITEYDAHNLYGTCKSFIIHS